MGEIRNSAEVRSAFSGTENPAGLVLLEDDTLEAAQFGGFTKNDACSFWGVCI